MKEVKDFQIEDIDGCEFAHSNVVGTGKVHVVYPDASHKAITVDEAQLLLDTGEWKVYRVNSV